MTAPDYLPTTQWLVLKERARLTACVRRFFDEHGYVEVETPLLSHDRVIDPNIEPFVVRDGERELFLQTSPEFGMKRLLAAGATAIYQLGKVFRKEERGQWHNPEFTLLEWYRVGDDHHTQMSFTESLVRAVFAEVRKSFAPGSFRRTTYAEAFQRTYGISIFETPIKQLANLARECGLHPPPGLASEDRDGWLNWLLVEKVEPQLGVEQPEFLHDYPASQAALAVIRPGPPAVAERFELYYQGIELCNGYHELCDAELLRRRILADWEGRTDAAPTHSYLLQAMEAGLPPSSGVALGLDRLFLLALGLRDMSEILPFPFERA